MIKKKLVICMFVFMLISTLLTGCSNGSNKAEDNSKGKISTKFESFTGVKEKSIRLSEGKNITIKYNSKIKSGSLNIKVVCPYGIEIDLGSNIKGTKDIKTKYEGDYKIVVTGEKANGFYEIKYKIK